MTDITYKIGDCVNLMRELQDGSVDLVLTDPPYTNPTVMAMGRKKFRNYGDLSIQRTYFDVIRMEFERVLKPEGRVFIFCDEDYYPILFQVFYEWASTNMIVWDKGRIGLGKPFRRQHELIFYACRMPYEHQKHLKFYSTIMRYAPLSSSLRLHPSQKPLRLLMDLIGGFSSVGDTVLDPFLGSGSTLLACRMMDRNGIGFEINESYEEIIKKRISEVNTFIEKKIEDGVVE